MFPPFHSTEGAAGVVGGTGVGGDAVKTAVDVAVATGGMVQDQLEADPDASVGERLALGVSKCR
jgi:hypothetical protein